MSRMTAEQLIARAVECVTCGKEHEHRQISQGRWTWAGHDGHLYRTRLCAMTGNSHAGAIEALRTLAESDR